MSVLATCENCMYRYQGECHRHSPQVVRGPDHAYAEWPEVGPRDWCGDFYMAARHERAGEVIIRWPGGEE